MVRVSNFIEKRWVAELRRSKIQEPREKSIKNEIQLN
jgi:hypothetical protein